PNVQGTRSVLRFLQEVFRRAEKGLATFGDVLQRRGQPMSSSDRIRVGEHLVERKVLDEIARELRQYQHRRRRYEYLRLRYQQIPLESPLPAEGGSRASLPSDPTLRAVEQMEAIREIGRASCRE